MISSKSGTYCWYYYLGVSNNYCAPNRFSGSFDYNFKTWYILGSPHRLYGFAQCFKYIGGSSWYINGKKLKLFKKAP